MRFLKLALRNWFCCKNFQKIFFPNISLKSNNSIIKAFDQWTYSWEMDLFPDALQNFYEKESSQKILKNTSDEVLKRKFSQKKEWLPKNDKTKQSEREESIV